MAKTFKSPMVPAVVDFKSDKELATLVESARDQFLNMQNSWWQFAKIIHRIRDTEAYKHVAETFKDYCSSDFPSMSYETLTKFCHIVEDFSDTIDSRIEKDAEYKLPAYESCYRLTTLKEDVVPKEELSKLRKSVFDGKLTYASLKDRIKEIASKTRDRFHKEMDDKVDKVEEELLKDLKDEEFYEESILDSVDTQSEEEESEEEVPTPWANNIISLNLKVLHIKDNLPILTNNLKKFKMTEELVSLGENLVEMATAVENFLNKLEEKSNDE